MTTDFLSASGRSAAGRLADDLARVFGARLLVVAAFEPASGPSSDLPVHTIALVDRLTPQDLGALLTVVPAWHKAKLATPLLLGREEFERTLDVFPIEYASILSRHVVLRGEWPTPGLEVGAADLRRACERQIKGHLIHLREGFLETHGRPAAIAELVRASVPAFRSSLRHVAWLRGANVSTDRALADFAASVEIDRALVEQVLAFPPAGQSTEAGELFPRYLEATERLWQQVDRA